MQSKTVSKDAIYGEVVTHSFIAEETKPLRMAILVEMIQVNQLRTNLICNTALWSVDDPVCSWRNGGFFTIRTVWVVNVMLDTR
ncbi:hypothetical protein AK961_05870 [Serratia marcescens]|nr:hypothetical protein AK961_05870 [Serratia marcescens]